MTAACTGASPWFLQTRRNKTRTRGTNDQDLQVTKLPRPRRVLYPSLLPFLHLASITHGSICWDLMASQLGRPSRVRSAVKSPGPWGRSPEERSRCQPLVVGHSAVQCFKEVCVLGLLFKGAFHSILHQFTHGEESLMAAVLLRLHQGIPVFSMELKMTRSLHLLY